MTALDFPSDPYANIVDLYDLEHDDFADDIPFYLNSVTSVGDPVLELGCGTGRLLRRIADAGFRVTGLDRSTAMLARANDSLTLGQRRRVSLHEDDMTAASDAPGGPFGLVIFSLNGLLHLTSPDEQLAALSSAHAALDPRGQLLIDVLNPTWEAFRQLEQGVTHEGSWPRGNGTRIDKFSSRKISTATQMIQTHIWYDINSSDASLKRIATSFDLRYLHRAELELMLRLAGFREWQIYGSYDLDPFDDASERLIVAAEPS